MKRTLILLSAICMALSAMAQNWSPVGENIRTPWADQVDPSCPRPEYPRPQMVRGSWMNLNGLWNYAITSAEAADFTGEGQVLVPFAVESSLSGVDAR